MNWDLIPWHFCACFFLVIVATVDETELGDEVGTDAGVHPPVEHTEASAPEQVPGDRQATREPEAVDETEIGSEADETEIDGK